MKIPFLTKGTTLIDRMGVATQYFFNWLALVQSLFDQGYSGTITTAALTNTGTQGSMTFMNGVLISQTAAT
jgi:hypothetical protein